MADRPVLDIHPLDARPAFPEAEITGPDLRVRPVPRPALTSLCARKGEAAALAASLQAAFGLTPPDGPAWAEANGLELIGVGPHAWLALAETEETADRLAQACQGCAAMADQSGAYGLLALEGDGVRDLLARGAALDLDDRVFPQGAAATFSLGHFGAILWRRPGPHQFRLALARSTAGDAWRFLAHAAESLAACAAPPRP